jgi:uncharacterized C2H2 Zn-finger protein
MKNITLSITIQPEIYYPCPYCACYYGRKKDLVKHINAHASDDILIPTRIYYKKAKEI